MDKTYDKLVTKFNNINNKINSKENELEKLDKERSIVIKQILELIEGNNSNNKVIKKKLIKYNIYFKFFNKLFMFKYGKWIKLPPSTDFPRELSEDVWILPLDIESQKK